MLTPWWRALRWPGAGRTSPTVTGSCTRTPCRRWVGWRCSRASRSPWPFSGLRAFSRRPDVQFRELGCRWWSPGSASASSASWTTARRAPVAKLAVQTGAAVYLYLNGFQIQGLESARWRDRLGRPGAAGHGALARRDEQRLQPDRRAGWAGGGAGARLDARAAGGGRAQRPMGDGAGGRGPRGGAPRLPALQLQSRPRVPRGLRGAAGGVHPCGDRGEELDQGVRGDRGGGAAAGARAADPRRGPCRGAARGAAAAGFRGRTAITSTTGWWIWG